ncbi:uncharacterized protein LOC128220561 [Mya arenaria]|uniref:uncharacterized protein LOC128220561 n=1 Tax=Mya arenaria TaxID=6604 RepID=UPI0022DFC949|nr:uncharacterized protein LOC128220561 [Mya arenaria]
MDNLYEFSKAYQFGFDLRDVPLVCDCNVQPYHNLVAKWLKTMWKDFYEIKCAGPSKLKGQLLFKLDPIEFICEKSTENGCQKGCSCIDQPERNTLNINCSNAQLSKMPIIPTSNFSKFVHLDLSHNFIKDINASYLKRLSFLDLTGNRLSHVPEIIITQLDNATIILSHNKFLRAIPRNMQFRSLCNTTLSYLQLDCGCDNVWIEQWLRSKECKSKHEDLTGFMCLVPGTGLIPAPKFKEDMVVCDAKETILGMLAGINSSFLGLLLIVGLFVYFFRYEIIVIWLRINQTNKNHDNYVYDVALSLNEDDDELRKWVTLNLIPNLKRYSIYRPYFDSDFGDVRDSAVAKTFATCRTFLVILSESYLEEGVGDSDEHPERSWTENEWKFAWHQYRSDYSKTVIVINYDHLSSYEVKHPQIRAVLRVGHVVNFGNHGPEDEFFHDVIRKIGPAGSNGRIRRFGPGSQQTDFVAMPGFLVPKE